MTEKDGKSGYNGYDSTLTFFEKKNNKYNIFVYDMFYIKIYSPYLLNLNNHLQKEHLELYSSENNIKSTTINNERLGLVKKKNLFIYIN